jgi:hypothetical protein
VQPLPKNFDKKREYDYHTFGNNQLHSGGTVITSLCFCMCFLWRTKLYYNTHIFEHWKQCNSTTINADDNQGNARAQSQLVNDFFSACGYNDTHVRGQANPVELLWEFTVCQGAPRHLLQLAEKISSVFLWPTRHRVGFTHGTTRDQMNMKHMADIEHTSAMIEIMNQIKYAFGHGPLARKIQ